MPNDPLPRRRSGVTGTALPNSESDRAGRGEGGAKLHLPDCAETFVIGDTVCVRIPTARPIPKVAPAVEQQGGHVARALKAGLGDVRVAGRFRLPPPRRSGQDRSRSGRHRHGCSPDECPTGMVSLGRRTCTLPDRGAQPKAVAWSWVWTHWRGENSARLITHPQSAETASPDAASHVRPDHASTGVLGASLSRTRTILSSTIVILGFGAFGHLAAISLTPHVHVLVSDPRKKARLDARALGMPTIKAAEVRWAYVVVLSMPLAAQKACLMRMLLPPDIEVFATLTMSGPPRALGAASRACRS